MALLHKHPKQTDDRPDPKSDPKTDPKKDLNSDVGTGPDRKADPDPRTSPKGAKLKRSFGWLALLGSILVLAGIVGLFYTAIVTLTSMLLFGWLLLIGGTVGLLHAVQARGTNFFWLGVVVAALNIAAGVVVVARPHVAAEALTMFAALLFLTGGVFRLIGSLVVRGPQFAVTLLQGAFGLLLGVLVLAEWPSSSQYVIGCFFSLALLFDGLGLFAAGLGGRRIVSLVAGDTAVQTEETVKAEQEGQEQSHN
ncbi:HdeD family acid-resistance protein [Streptomyces sp. NPDC059009]|uniref:HdeD family acid-resistance protein n=1 Tax=Streptomyces sp. NPDC059009 TaxID=3346694 RepID=UPI0036BA16F5